MTELRAREINGELCWLARSLGDYLGYGSKGGNLSRMFKGKWAFTLVAGVDYHIAPAGNAKEAVWIPASMLSKLFTRICEEQPKYAAHVPTLLELLVPNSIPVEHVGLAKLNARIQDLEDTVEGIHGKRIKLMAKEPVQLALPGHKDKEPRTKIKRRHRLALDRVAKEAQAEKCGGIKASITKGYKHYGEGIRYTGQKRGLKGEKVHLRPEAIESLKRLSAPALKGLVIKDVTAKERRKIRLIREMITDNRRWAMKVSGSSRVSNHFKAAITRGAATRTYYKLKVTDG